MASPNAFIHWFSNRMRAVGVRFAITSGQACVHYGIQQTTKDSDWIIEPADFVLLRTLLESIDASRLSRVSYRAICVVPALEVLLP